MNSLSPPTPSHYLWWIWMVYLSPWCLYVYICCIVLCVTVWVDDVAPGCVVSRISSIKYQTQNVAWSRTGGSSFSNLILNILNKRYCTKLNLIHSGADLRAFLHINKAMWILKSVSFLIGISTSYLWKCKWFNMVLTPHILTLNL